MASGYNGPTQKSQYFFDAVGNRDSVTNANGTSAGYHYDNLNRLVNVTNWGNGTVISSYSYALNNTGIRTAVTEADGSRVDYGYDASYKLTSETRSGTHPYSISYVYDNVGNRLSQTKDGITTTYSYNSRDQLSTENCQLSTISYTYDHAGRMATKTDASGTVTYSWLDNDRMASVSGPGVLATYDYDAAGQRVGESAGGSTKKYLIDYQLPYGQVIAETDASGNLVVGYVYGLDRISMTRGASTHTYSTDGQGSIRQLTNAAGTVTDEYFYTGFGSLLARTGTTVNPFQYVGEQFDANSGFYNLRARLYNPENGRFTSVDPYEGDPQAPLTLHRYLYSNASPTNYSDPSGNFIFDLATAYLAINLSNTVASYPIPGIIIRGTTTQFEVEVIEYGTKQAWESDPYQAVIWLRNGLLATSVIGSSWPNPYLPNVPPYNVNYPGIAEGEYKAIYNIHGHHPAGEATPAIELQGNIPTLGPNPGQNGNNWADNIEIHEGWSATWRGSINCITIKKGQAQSIWNLLRDKQEGSVKVKRNIPSPWGEIS